MKSQEKHLYYLSELSDYKIDSNYTDVHGWPVKDSALRTIGTVNNLLVNKQTERVVYLDVEVDATIIDAKHDPYRRPASTDTREYINQDGENHIIIPIGLVDINTEEKFVFTEIIDHKTFAETKRVRSNTPIVRDYENNVLNSYRRRFINQPQVEGFDPEKENAEFYKKDYINRMEDGLETEKQSEDQATTVASDNKVDWYDAENESIKSQKEIEEQELKRDFYDRNQFDDSNFHRNKKDY